MPQSVDTPYQILIPLLFPHKQLPILITMPVAPVVGKLRKRLITDLTASIGIGLAGAYTFWYTVHLPMVKRRDDYYLRLEQAKSS